MGPKKGRRLRRIEVPTDSVPEFELGDTEADIQQRREKREEQAQRRELQKVGPGLRKATQKLRLEEKQDIYRTDSHEEI